MQVSAGILFVLNNRVLLAHSTNSRWWNSWMPPKGKVEAGESLEDAAVRETEEEIGWRIDKKHLGESFLVKYQRRNTTWKEIHIFPVYLNGSNDDRLKIVGDLQKEEIDSVEWMDSENVKKRANLVYIEDILNILKK
jgi:8-oxo-dGTP pyrophosphatase MutT (NUDIX family)